MSRVEEVENSIRWAMSNALAGNSTKPDMVKIARALAAELESVKAERDALATSGALVPVRIEPKPIGHDGWFMTPTGLGWLGSDKRGDPCVETQTHYYDAAHCYPVRLVPVTEWEAKP